MDTIAIGYTLAKPVRTQEECDAYAAMAQAVAAHNAACAVGDTLWMIEDKENCYAVADGGVVQEPEEQPDPEPTLKEQLAALQAAQEDADALNVDQDYRITLLELGVTDDDTTETTD